MNKSYEIEPALHEIKHYIDCTFNKLEHYKYGDESAKRMVVTYTNLINEKVEKINQELLNKFLFNDQ